MNAPSGPIRFDLNTRLNANPNDSPIHGSL